MLDITISVVSTIKNVNTLLNNTHIRQAKKFDSVVLGLTGTIPVLTGLFNPRLGSAISMGTDLIISLKNYEFYQVALHTCRFVILFHPIGLELRVVLMFIQIISELEMVYKSYKNEQYANAIANFALAGLNTYQMRLKINQLSQKWNSAPLVQQPQISLEVKNIVPRELEFAYCDLSDMGEENEFFGKYLIENQDEIAKSLNNKMSADISRKVSSIISVQNKNIQVSTNVAVQTENLTGSFGTFILSWRMLTKVLPAIFSNIFSRSS